MRRLLSPLTRWLDRRIDARSEAVDRCRLEGDSALHRGLRAAVLFLFGFGRTALAIMIVADGTLYITSLGQMSIPPVSAHRVSQPHRAGPSRSIVGPASLTRGSDAPVSRRPGASEAPAAGHRRALRGGDSSFELGRGGDAPALSGGRA